MKRKWLVLSGLAVSIVTFGVVVVIPRFEQMLEYSRKGEKLAHVGDLKSAISIYYGDTQGVWPPTLDVLIPKYIKAIPDDGVTGSNKVVSTYDGTGGWVYNKITGEIKPNLPKAALTPTNNW